LPKRDPCPRILVVGRLYDLRMSIEKEIEEKHLDPFRTKGMIGLKAGFLIGLINQATPDDEVKIAKLRSAANEVLKLSL